MTKEEGKAIAGAINGALGLALEKLVGKGTPSGPNGAEARAMPLGQPIGGPGADYTKVGDPPRNEEEQYQRFKRRLIDECRVDPILLTLLTTSNAIEVQVEPRLETLTGTGTRARVARLLAQGYFTEARATGNVRKELARTGADPGGGGGLSDVLGNFVKDGFMVRAGEGYQIAPGVIVTEKILEAR